MDKILFLILLIFILALLTENKYLHITIFSILLVYIFPRLYIYLKERIVGLILPFYKNIGDLQVTHLYGVTKYSMYIEILDTHHNILDYSPIQFYGHSKLFLDGIIIYPDIRYYLLYLKENGKMSTYIKISYSSKRAEDAFKKLKTTYEYITRHLENFGLVYRLTRPPNIKYIVRKKINSKNILILSLIISFLSLILVIKGFSLNYLTILDIYFNIMFLCLVKELVKKSDKIVFDGEILELYKNEVIETIPTVGEIYRRSKWIYNMLNTLQNFFLILEIKKAPEEASQSIEKKSFRRYELATALDKLSILSSAEKMYTTVQRRLNKRENFYYTRLVVFANSKNERDSIKSVFYSLGFKMKKPLYFSPILDMLK